MVLLERFPQKLKYFHLLGKSSHGMHRLPTNSRDNAQQAATPPTGAPRVNRIQCEKFSTSRYLAKIGVFTGKNHTGNGVFPLDFFINEVRPSFIQSSPLQSFRHTSPSHCRLFAAVPADGHRLGWRNGQSSLRPFEIEVLRRLDHDLARL